jgi:hypothetical protein
MYDAVVVGARCAGGVTCPGRHSLLQCMPGHVGISRRAGLKLAEQIKSDGGNHDRIHTQSPGMGGRASRTL